MLKLIKSWFFSCEPKKEEDIKWVRILPHTYNFGEGSWYKHKIGHHYPVKDYTDKVYIVVSKDKELLFIDKCHVVIENV